MEEFDIYIEPGEPLTEQTRLSARNAANLLLCFATMRDALAIARGASFSEVAWWGEHRGFHLHQLQERFYFIESERSIRGPFPLYFFLREVGSDLLSTGKRPAAYLPAQSALMNINEIELNIGYMTTRGLELRAVTIGSIHIRIRELIDALAKQFHHLIESAESLIHKEKKDGYYQVAAEITSNASHEREFAAGLLVVCGLTLEHAIEYPLAVKRLEVRPLTKG